MPLAENIPGYNPDPFENLVEGLDDVLADGDAIALMPYDDGTLYPKRAYFDKNLIGGIGGYETADGDKIAVDGEGEAVKNLFGVPVLLACDPTEHAAAVDPMKALVAHKNDIGEWLRLDRQGTVVQVGPALRPAPEILDAGSVDEAMKSAGAANLLALAYGEEVLEEYEVPPERQASFLDRVRDEAGQNLDPAEIEGPIYDVEAMQRDVEEYEDEIREAVHRTLQLDLEPEVNANGMVADGGLAGEHMRQRNEQAQTDPNIQPMTFEEALVELAERGDIEKIYDIAPPAGIVQDRFGDIQVDQATHIAVSQSKAAGLLPTTWDTVEINTALDKARMEEYEEGKWMKYMIYGIIIGAILVAVCALLFAGVFSIA